MIKYSIKGGYLMKELMKYIDDSLSGIPDSKSFYKYKKAIVDEITDRANEITHAGIDDENVVRDLIISEYPDIRGEYGRLVDEEKKKRHKKQIRLACIFGSIIYFLVIVIAFLAVSFVTGDWAHTWVYLVSFIFAYLSAALIWIVVKLSRRQSLFHPVSRIFIALAVMLLTLTVFLYLKVIFDVNKSWLAFIFGVLAMMSADGIYAEKASERFAIFFHILYIVPAAAMIYIILGSLSVIPWHPGWLLIPASLIIVLLVIFIRILDHNKHKSQEIEEDSEWKDS